MKKFFSSESVTEGHPDKVADAIADAILDHILAQDPNARVACEVSLTPKMALIFGEISTNAKVDIDRIVRNKIREIGYTKEVSAFNDESVEIINQLGTQSPDIALGVDKEDQGAGDQGLMFGYASDESANAMPMSIDLAHKLAKRLTQVRKENIVEGLRPDGKTQVTVEYDDNDQVKRIDTVVVSTQHAASLSQETLRSLIIKHVIWDVIPKHLLDDQTKYFINPTGRFIVGGPEGDSGLTGRKIIVDSYGGVARHGGGAFSGKDASKVDRSAAYMARYIAKNIVASGVCKKVEIQLAYAIGVSKPVSIFVETFGTHQVSVEKIYQAIEKHFDLRPKAIIETLKLKRPIFGHTTVYGHFGKEDDVIFTWEKTDKIAIFKDLL